MSGQVCWSHFPKQASCHSSERVSKGHSRFLKQSKHASSLASEKASRDNAAKDTDPLARRLPPGLWKKLSQESSGIVEK
jgi:hypothetical protein